MTALIIPAAVAALALPGTTARATTVIPLTVEDLARSSVASVLGTVQAVESVETHDGTLHTLVTVTVEEVVSGALEARVIVLKEDGGTVRGRQEVHIGAPRFLAGERVLLFLTARPDGSLRTNHLALGKFDVALDRRGMPQLQQRFEAGISVLLPSGATAPPPTARPLGDVLAAIARSGGTRGSMPGRQAMQAIPPEATDAALLRDAGATFALLGGRFFEPDEGLSLPFVIDQSGDAILGLSTSRDAVAAALAAWSTVAGATLRLHDAGLTDDLSAPCFGPSVVIFNDPTHAMLPPVSCTGIMALASYCTTSFESKRFAGRTFQRALRGKVTFAKGWDACPHVWTACHLAEIATHEIGHTIGLAHSSEDFFEVDERRRDATMYYRPHFDGRCAGIQADDAEAVALLYPEATPPVVLTADLPTAVAGAPYSWLLTAGGGAGNFTWTLSGGNLPEFSVSAGGELSGIPTSGRTGFLQVRATDGNGDSHTKLLNLTIAGPTAAPTHTPTRTTTPTRTATATATAIATQTDTPAPTATATAPPSPSPSPTATASPTPSASPPAPFTETPGATPTPTGTETPASPHATASPTPTPTPMETPTPTETPQAACAGDCDRSGEVTIDELLAMVRIALGVGDLVVCTAGDGNGDGAITIDEILVAVANALTGCPEHLPPAGA